jgi:hypothetical protein
MSAPSPENGGGHSGSGEISVAAKCEGVSSLHSSYKVMSTSTGQASSVPIPISPAGKPGCDERGGLCSPSLQCGGNDSATSTSLDADDEADAGPPADTAELASTPSSAPVYPAGHRWLVESHEGDSPLQRINTLQRESAHAVPTHDTLLSLPHSMSTEQHKTPNSSALPTQPTPSLTPALRRHRSEKRSAGSNSFRGGRQASSSDSTPLSSPPGPRSACVLLSQPPSTFLLSTVGGDEKTKDDYAEAGNSAAASAVPAMRCASSEGKAGMNLSSSPPAFPSLVTAATAADYSDSSPGPRNTEAFHSPLSAHLRLAPRMNAELQQFGCCVFFFPTPLVSWLFPLIGHVAISNAEGSRLFTFESSYYVREEKLVAVLGRVLREEMNSSELSSPTRRSRPGLDFLGRRGKAADRATSPSPAQSSLPCRGSGMSDASTSDPGLNSPCRGCAASPDLRSASAPLFPLHPPTRPPRRTGRSRSSTAASTSGHTHTRCVRIWDLKPLLMESRGQRTKRAPYSITREGGKQAAVALWERLQELLQPIDGNAGICVSAKGGTARSQPVSRTKVDQANKAEGTHSATSASSSTDDEDDEYELLDAETAHFFNRNLNATIRLFRGSADGSNNSPDVVLQHHSSFSFVGFVLEACGIGSQAKPSRSPLTPGAAGSGGGNASNGRDQGKQNDANGRAASSGVTTMIAATGDNADAADEIHWGVLKLLFHVFVFGKWHRGEGRLRRALHGGSITSATILWVIILAVCLHYFRLMFS